MAQPSSTSCPRGAASGAHCANPRGRGGPGESTERSQAVGCTSCCTVCSWRAVATCYAAPSDVPPTHLRAGLLVAPQRSGQSAQVAAPQGLLLFQALCSTRRCTKHEQGVGDEPVIAAQVQPWQHSVTLPRTDRSLVARCFPYQARHQAPNAAVKQTTCYYTPPRPTSDARKGSLGHAGAAWQPRAQRARQRQLDVFAQLLFIVPTRLQL